MTITILTLLAIINSLAPCYTAPSSTPQCPPSTMPPRNVHSTPNAQRRRQEDVVMTDVVPQLEKETNTTDELIAANEDNLMAVDKNQSLAVISLTSLPIPASVSLTTLGRKRRH